MLAGVAAQTEARHLARVGAPQQIDLQTAGAAGRKAHIFAARMGNFDKPVADLGGAAADMPAITTVLADPPANSVPELTRVPLTISLPPLCVSTITPEPIMPPISFSLVPLATVTIEPDTNAPNC